MCYTLPQDYVKKLEDIFGRDGSKLAKMKLAELNSHFNPLFESMRVGLNKTTGKGLLKEYSPWLHNFQANVYPESIEIPGLQICMYVAKKFNLEIRACIG